MLVHERQQTANVAGGQVDFVATEINLDVLTSEDEEGLSGTPIQQIIPGEPMSLFAQIGAH